MEWNYLTSPQDFGDPTVVTPQTLIALENFLFSFSENPTIQNSYDKSSADLIQGRLRVIRDDWVRRVCDSSADDASLDGSESLDSSISLSTKSEPSEFQRTPLQICSKMSIASILN
jgi:hypothetical protein